RRPSRKGSARASWPNSPPTWKPSPRRAGSAATSTAIRVPAPERGEARAVRTAGPEPAEDPQRPRQQPVARDRSGISRPANQREILITGGPPGRPAAHPSPKRHRGRSRPLAETASILWRLGELITTQKTRSQR